MVGDIIELVFVIREFMEAVGVSELACFDIERNVELCNSDEEL